MSTQPPSASPDPDKDALFNKPREDARMDVITDVYNARYFRELLSLEAARAQRYKVPLSLAIGDIDKLKQLNDTFGYPSGDQVLKAVAALLQFSTRVTDFVCRIGGDELAIIFTHTPLRDATRVCERLNHCLYKLPLPDELRNAVNLTFGIGEYDVGQYRPRESSEDFIMRVEQALHRAKKGDDPNEGLLGVPVRV